jgi:hypothetical protein
MSCNAMQCILYKIYFLESFFYMYYNLICIFICTPIWTKKLFLEKVGVTGGDLGASHLKSYRGLHILGLEVGPCIIVLVVVIASAMFSNFEHFII